MEDLVDSGKVRFIGVCNFSISQLKRVQGALLKHTIVTNQVDYSLITRSVEAGLFKYCRENHITIIAHSPLGRGLQNIKLKDRDKSLTQVSGAIGKTEAQVALNWCTSNDIVVAVPKGNSVDHVEENCNSSGWRLSSEQIVLLERSIKPFRRRGPAEVAFRRRARGVLTRGSPTLRSKYDAGL